MIRSEPFGTLADGTAVTLYSLENSQGESVQLLDYGACIHGVFLRDGLGLLRDVTLGASRAAELAGFTHEGVTIGRVANRIAYGRCSVEGISLQLECNHRGHFLHGGSGNYAHKLFQAQFHPGGDQIRFSLLDDGAGGFGCSAQAAVSFQFGEDRCLRIRYQLEADGTTIFCPTNHVYFDLSGTGDALNHFLRVSAEAYAAKGPLGMPQGDTRPVADTPMDYRSAQRIGAGLQAGCGGFFPGETPQMDDTFLLEPGAGQAAELFYPPTGLMVRVRTDMPALVVFTPFVRTPRPGKHGRFYAGYCGVALETQFVPNAVNCPSYALPVFHAGERFQSETVYSFHNIQLDRRHSP